MNERETQHRQTKDHFERVQNNNEKKKQTGMEWSINVRTNVGWMSGY